MRMAASSRADVERHDLVAGPQLHAPHAGGGAAHRPHVVLGEADGHALPRHHEDVVAPVGGDDPHQLVAVAQVDGDEPARSDESYSVNFVFLTWPELRREEQVAVALVVARVDDRLDLLVGRQRQQVDDGRARAVRSFIGISCALQPVHPARGSRRTAGRRGPWW